MSVLAQKELRTGRRTPPESIAAVSRGMDSAVAVGQWWLHTPNNTPSETYLPTSPRWLGMGRVGPIYHHSQTTGGPVGNKNIRET